MHNPLQTFLPWHRYLWSTRPSRGLRRSSRKQHQSRQRNCEDDQAARWQGWIFQILKRTFLGPRGPLIEPSISVRPPVHPSAPIFPKFIDELKHCRQVSGTPKTVYFLKAHDVCCPNSDENTNTKTKTNTKTETNKGKT